MRDQKGATGEYDTFDSMLTSLRFDEERTPSPLVTAAPAAITEIDGTWATSFTKDELQSSPLLYGGVGGGEFNDQNWGQLTFTFEQGRWVYTQENPAATSSGEGTFSVEGDTIVLNAANGEKFVMRWTLEGDTLTFERDDSLGVSPTPFVSRRGPGSPDGPRARVSPRGTIVVSTAGAIFRDRGHHDTARPSVTQQRCARVHVLTYVGCSADDVRSGLNRSRRPHELDEERHLNPLYQASGSADGVRRRQRTDVWASARRQAARTAARSPRARPAQPLRHRNGCDPCRNRRPPTPRVRPGPTHGALNRTGFDGGSASTPTSPSVSIARSVLVLPADTELVAGRVGHDTEPVRRVVMKPQ